MFSMLFCGQQITCDTPPLDEGPGGSGAMTWTALSEQYNRYADPYTGSRKLFPYANPYPSYLCQLVALEVTNLSHTHTVLFPICYF